MKRLFIILGILGVLIMVVSFCAWVEWDYNNNTPFGNPGKYTEPLDQEDVIYFCDLFSLPNSDERCDLTRATYANEFDPEVEVLAESGALDTFEQWGLIFGKYEAYCGPIIESEMEFTCIYDFRTNAVFEIIVVFDETGLMKWWRFSVNGD